MATHLTIIGMSLFAHPQTAMEGNDVPRLLPAHRTETLMELRRVVTDILGADIAGCRNFDFLLSHTSLLPYGLICRSSAPCGVMRFMSTAPTEQTPAMMSAPQMKRLKCAVAPTKMYAAPEMPNNRLSFTRFVTVPHFLFFA